MFSECDLYGRMLQSSISRFNPSSIVYIEIIVSVLFSQETLEDDIEELNSLRKPNTEVLTLGGATKITPPTYCKINFTKRIQKNIIAHRIR